MDEGITMEFVAHLLTLLRDAYHIIRAVDDPDNRHWLGQAELILGPILQDGEDVK